MKFNIGDKVSFLNEKLSGKVTRIINEELCKVETDDGFEIDVLAKELVLISRIESAEIPTTKDIIQPLLKQVENNSSDLFKLLDNDTVHFVAMPAEDMQVLTGPVSFFLINKTNYQLLFSFSFSIKNKIIGIISGVIKPQSEILLTKKKRTDMIDWQNFVIQAILFQNEEYKQTTPLHRELPLLLPDLKAEFTAVKGNASYAKCISLYAAGKEPVIDMEELKKKFAHDEEQQEVKTKSIPQRKFPQQEDDHLYGIIRNETEVDLHIQHLVDDYKNLSNAEMLQIQLQKFRKEMDNALKNHYHKIVFIHGVGNGVLRTEILRELRSYQGVRSGDASFEKYGFGATEVILV